MIIVLSYRCFYFLLIRDYHYYIITISISIYTVHCIGV